MTDENSHPARLPAIQMLRMGLVSPSEIADLAGVSPQHIDEWLRRSVQPFDWQAKRRKHLRDLWSHFRREY